ncbi:neutrophil cytosol factor 2 isoform X3 [Nothobranchius furzeri]|uniref:neutrophil cytosol factor 2 isoform X3 n=1 Tax=Nothobranchius furzeri TaxID=105023 RepID=UPI0039049FA7
MLYTELLQLWNESVQLVDARDWLGALEKLQQISEPTSRTHFNAASAHLALGQLEMALKSLDFTIAKDERLAVAFFQRSAVMMQMNRPEEALSDCIWAQKHMRGNVVIDYRQLGLRFKLYSWQRREDLSLLLVPEGVVFRPRKQEVEQLQQKDFLGKAKVITSMIPDDDFGGFEPLRQQKPGFYDPKTEGDQESRYVYVRGPHVARGPGQLTVPGGAMVFLFGEEDRNGMMNVIYDGQRGFLPASLLETADIKTSKGKKDNTPSGIPLPPELKPPTRPQTRHGLAAPPRRDPPPYSPAAHAPPSASEPPMCTANQQQAGLPEEVQAGSVVVKVHYTFSIALSVPLDTPYHQMKELIAQKLGQPGSLLRFRCKQHGARVLTPLNEEAEASFTVQEVAEAGRLTLWCQKEDPLANRTILYQMVAIYNYGGQGPEDLEFSEGDTIDVLGQVNDEWLEGHCAGNIGIFPSCFAYRENQGTIQDPVY